MTYAAFLVNCAVLVTYNCFLNGFDTVALLVFISKYVEWYQEKHFRNFVAVRIVSANRPWVADISTKPKQMKIKF